MAKQKSNFEQNRLAAELKPKRDRLKLTGSSGARGRDADTAQRLVPIPFTQPGDVLTLQTNDDGDLYAAWTDTGLSGSRYKEFVWVREGGGAFIFDVDGDAIWTLEPLQ